MEEEELILDQEQYAKLLKLQSDIQEAIANAIRDGKGVTVVRDKVIFNVRLLNDDTDDDTSIERYEVESRDKSITAKATKDKKGKISVDVDFDEKTVRNIMDAKRQKERDDDRAIQKNRVDGKDSDLLLKEIERKKKIGKAVQLDADREYSDRDNLIKFFREAVGEKNISEIYRVQGDSTHDFKYVIKSGNGKCKTLDFKELNEGKNPRQKVWLMVNGELIHKRVDSLLVKGHYAIATDFPDKVLSQNTTSYVVSRLPNGEYIGAEVAQKYGHNRNTSGNIMQKDNASRTKSKYQFEDIVKSAEMAKQCEEFKIDGKLSVEEEKLVARIREDKSLNIKQVKDVVSTILILKDLGLEKNQVKEMIENAKDGQGIEKTADAVKKAKERGAKKEDFVRNDDDDQKMPGGGYMRRGYDPRHPD